MSQRLSSRASVEGPGRAGGTNNTPSTHPGPSTDAWDDTRTRRIGILGGGVSGIALAAHLDDDVDILEKRDRIGGLCGTISEDGFTFDAAGPHIMFSKNKDVLNLMVEVLGDNVHQRRRDNKIWFKGKLVKYPFENDLASLPPQDNFECILGYIVNPHVNDEPHNLA